MAAGTELNRRPASPCSLPLASCGGIGEEGREELDLGVGPVRASDGRPSAASPSHSLSLSLLMAGSPGGSGLTSPPARVHRGEEGGLGPLFYCFSFCFFFGC